MHNSTLFSGKSSNYAAGRPSYAPELIDFAAGRLADSGAKVIADIGSGTGIFTRLLLDKGFKVFAVEPNDQMRSKAEESLSGLEGFVSVAASAEDTTLSDNSVDAVVCASSIHWFNLDEFKKEIRRILKPGGLMFVTINTRALDNEFSIKQHELCAKYCTNFTSLKHGDAKTRRAAEICINENFEAYAFDFPLHYSAESFINRSLSSSYSPLSGTKEYEAYVEELRRLIDEFFPDGKVTLPNHSMLYCGNIK